MTNAGVNGYPSSPAKSVVPFGQLSGTKSGCYYFLGSTATTSALWTQSRLMAMPVTFGKAVILDAIGGEVTSAGGSGCVVRLGIFNDTGDGYPGTLVLDAGTIDGTSTTVQEIVIAQALPAGAYHFGAVVQGSASMPTLRSVSAALGSGAAPTNASVASTTFCNFQNSVSGALGLFTTTVNTLNIMPRVFWKVH